MGFEKGAHVELRLRRTINESAADRAGAPRQAAIRHAVHTLRCGDMVDAARHVIALPRKRPDRAGAEAGLALAALARMGAWRQRRKVELDREEQSRAESVPQAIGRMDIAAERRAMAGSGAPGPAAEGQRRLVEGIDVLR